MEREDEERKLRRELRRIQRREQERVRNMLKHGLFGVVTLIIIAAVIVCVKLIVKEEVIHPADVEVPDFVNVNLLTPNPHSRPQLPLEKVNGIVVHYVANPCSTARENRNYFESLKDQDETSVSSHFVIGLEGEVVQCVPLDEIAYAVQTRNYDSISIECCYVSEDGSFTKATYDSLISLLAWLTDTYGLDTDHILRHYDCGGKKCPLYYTEHEDAWVQLKADVAARQE